jgi:hypothetical protein
MGRNPRRSNREETTMKIRIPLLGTGGELDRREIDTADDDSAEMSERIYDAFDDWILSPGDTIKIEEID